MGLVLCAGTTPGNLFSPGIAVSWEVRGAWEYLQSINKRSSRKTDVLFSQTTKCFSPLAWPLHMLKRLKTVNSRTRAMVEIEY